MLRGYQKRALKELNAYLSEREGNPCVVLPTGSGKSHVIASVCLEFLKLSPDVRVMILSHVKELLLQDGSKVLQEDKDAPLSYYSAGLGCKSLNAITIAGIQSIWKKSDEVGIIDFVIIDEAHTISNTESGMYREFLSGLLKNNPHMRIIGFTATPYRLGQGLLTEGDEALFSALIEPVTIEELISDGYLAKLTSRFTDFHMNTEGIKKVQGDYEQKELETRINTDDTNARVVRETIKLAKGRKSWLVFCVSVAHAENIRDEFIAQGVSSATITGQTPSKEREMIFADFKAGKIQALTNVGVATTGFDYPDIDVIVMARPTLSPGLYMQMSGRGMRIKSPGHAQDCLVLDFADNIARHGPITKIIPPRRSQMRKKKFQKTLGLLFRQCPKCKHAVLKRLRECPNCGHIFHELSQLNTTQDIMGLENNNNPEKMQVKSWHWKIIFTKKDHTPVIRVDFYSDNLMRGPVMMFLNLFHDGDASEKAYLNMKRLLRGVRLPTKKELANLPTINKLIEAVKNNFEPPTWIEFKKQGNYEIITKWGWEKE